jgi:hypothetical protein
MLTKLREAESFICDKTAEITTVDIPNSASAATARYGCCNLVLPLISSFFA